MKHLVKFLGSMDSNQHEINSFFSNSKITNSHYEELSGEQIIELNLETFLSTKDVINITDLIRRDTWKHQYIMYYWTQDIFKILYPKQLSGVVLDDYKYELIKIDDKPPKLKLRLLFHSTDLREPENLIKIAIRKMYLKSPRIFFLQHT